MTQLKSNKFEVVPSILSLLPFLLRRLNVTRASEVSISKELLFLFHSSSTLSQLKQRVQSEAKGCSSWFFTSRVNAASRNFNRRENATDLCKFARCPPQRVFTLGSRNQTIFTLENALRASIFPGSVPILTVASRNCLFISTTASAVVPVFD